MQDTKLESVKAKMISSAVAAVQSSVADHIRNLECYGQEAELFKLANELSGHILAFRAEASSVAQAQPQLQAETALTT